MINLIRDICLDFLDQNNVKINSKSERNNFKFSFDRVFDYNSTQSDIYESSARPIIDSVLEGFNGTIFAYGQTSSGKTFTMQGVLEDRNLQGIIPRIITYTYGYISDVCLFDNSIQFAVKVSILEIYNEKIKDLIETNRMNLQIREDKKKGIYIEDLSEHEAGNSSDVMKQITKGMNNRAVNSTNMNDQSSRSHSIVILNIRQTNNKDLSVKTGKLYLVDLAGSEKISKTGATGVVLDEAKAINKSLTTLGIVINSLTDGKNGHIPYRESKLTRVLQESLGGNARTCLIITCSPSSYNEAETLSTLRFGLRAKKVKNNAKVNKEYSIQELKTQVNTLEGQMSFFKERIYVLEDYLNKNGLPVPNNEEEIKPPQSLPIINPTQLEINNQTLTDPNIPELNSKYIEVLGLVNDLEYEKEELANKLSEALKFINEIKIEQKNKDTIITEIENLKKTSNNRVDEMHGEMIKFKKHLEKTKNDLTLINEVNGSMEFAQSFLLNETVIDTKENNTEFIKITEEIENPNENCPDLDIDSCSKSHKNERESTYPSTLFNNGLRTGSLCESNFIHSLNNNYTRDLLENFSNEPDFAKNQAVEELINKLKGYSEKYPEIAEVVDEFKEKMNTENKKNSREISNSINKSDNKFSENSVNSRDSSSVCEDLQKKENLKNNVMSDLNSKVERMFDIRLGKKASQFDNTNQGKNVLENRSLLRSWKEKFKNVDTNKK